MVAIDYREDIAVQYGTARLLAYYGAATDAQKERGRRWYDEARKACREIAKDTGYTATQVAAVLAITSPDAQLVHNVRWTRQACESGGATAGRYPADQLPKVRGALSDRRDPGQYVRGPKVAAFFAGIVGKDELVIDRWAAYAAGATKERAPVTAERHAIDAAYRRAAAIAGERIRDFQAIVWISVRESTTRRNGVTVRYSDIAS